MWVEVGMLASWCVILYSRPTVSSLWMLEVVCGSRMMLPYYSKMGRTRVV